MDLTPFAKKSVLLVGQDRKNIMEALFAVVGEVNTQFFGVYYPTEDELNHDLQAITLVKFFNKTRLCCRQIGGAN